MHEQTLVKLGLDEEVFERSCEDYDDQVEVDRDAELGAFGKLCRDLACVTEQICSHRA